MFRYTEGSHVHYCTWKNEKFQQTEMKSLNLRSEAREAPEVALGSALACVYVSLR